MTRRQIILSAASLAVLATILPLLAMSYWSYKRSVMAEQRHLADYARWTIMRTSRTMTLAKAALTTIEAEKHVGCSDEHIARMRQLTVDTRSVEEMGYFENGVLKCTSWGRVTQRVPREDVDYLTQDKFTLALRVRPAVVQGGGLIALGHGAHNVLIKPERLVDVLLDSGMALAIATDRGQVLATLNAPDPALIRRVIARPASGMDETFLFSGLRADGWIAVAVANRDVLRARFGSERLILLPLGLIMAALMVGLIAWVSRQRLSPAGELAVAIRKREFIVHYQPIIELSTGLCVGAEALVRWRRPDGASIRPDFFIPLAEDCGLIAPLTDQIIDCVARDLSTMLVRDRTIHIAINIAPQDMESGRFLPVLADVLARAGIEASQIWLEATERGFMNAEAARATIEKARAAGHLVAIDDFGTGYSSLSRLETLPLDALKIDKSFVDSIGTDAATNIVTPHIITIAQKLNFRIVAEGVETEAQAEQLRAMGVQFAQGWLYAQALPAEAFIAFYRERNAGRVPDFLLEIM